MLEKLKIFLEKKIKKYYKIKLLKLIYGILFYRNLTKNNFAKSEGIIELLIFYKLLKADNNLDFVKTRFNNTAYNYETNIKTSSYLNGELNLILNQIKTFNLINNNSTLLDLGCGTGCLAKSLITKPKTITGVDISNEMLKIARKKKLYNELKCQSIIDYLLFTKKRFDLITAASVIQFFSLSEFESLVAIIKNKNILKKNGSVIISFDISNSSTKLNNKLFYEHNIVDITNIIKKYFKLLSLKKNRIGRIEKNKPIHCGCVLFTNN